MHLANGKVLILSLIVNAVLASALWVMAGHAPNHLLTRTRPPPGQAAAQALRWQDCGLQTDRPMLQLLEYAHSPDPLVYRRWNNISKRWQFKDLEQPGATLLTLREKVQVARRNSSTAPWETYFQNEFDVCAHHKGICGAIKSPGTFAYSDHHPPTSSVYSKHFRAIEYFYVNGVFAGCATVLYNQNYGIQN